MVGGGNAAGGSGTQLSLSPWWQQDSRAGNKGGGIRALGKQEQTKIPYPLYPPQKKTSVLCFIFSNEKMKINAVLGFRLRHI